MTNLFADDVVAMVTERIQAETDRRLDGVEFDPDVRRHIRALVLANVMKEAGPEFEQVRSDFGNWWKEQARESSQIISQTPPRLASKLGQVIETMMSKPQGTA